jgi:hypothetical protein
MPLLKQRKWRERFYTQRTHLFSSASACRSDSSVSFPHIQSWQRHRYTKAELGASVLAWSKCACVF